MFFFRFFSIRCYYKILSRVSCAIQQVLVGNLLWIQQWVYFNPQILINPSPSSFRNYKFIFYVCEVISALQISSFGPLDTTYKRYHVFVFFCLTPMFTAALFTIAKTQKQLKSPSADEWIKKTWYIYTVEYYTAIKRMKRCHLQHHGWVQRVSY